MSLSWRVLLHNREKRGFAELPSAIQKPTEHAFETGRMFLLDERPYPVGFDHHLLPLGLIGSATSPITSPFFNRYATRTVDYDLPYTDDSMLVYTKLGKFAFFGFVANCPDAGWFGTKLKVRNGMFNPSGTFGVPPGVLAFLSSKADDTAGALASMSERQKRKVHGVLAKEGFSPESFRAFERDVAVFGEEARFVTDPPTGK